MLHSICQQIRKTQQWPQDWKRSVFILIPKKGNAKECSSEVKSLSRVRLFVTPWTVDYQASLSMEFSRQEYWSGLPLPSPKNAQTTTQLHSSHTLPKECSKFSKLGFKSMWTKNSQMFKLDLEKAKEPEINCRHLLDCRKARELQKNLYFCFTDYAETFDGVDHNRLWNILK